MTEDLDFNRLKRDMELQVAVGGWVGVDPQTVLTLIEQLHAKTQSRLQKLELARDGVQRIISLHPPGVVPGLPGGMPGCTHCSHGVTVGDEGGSGGVFWPCPTLRALVGIPEMSQLEATHKFFEWRAALADSEGKP